MGRSKDKPKIDLSGNQQPIIHNEGSKKEKKKKLIVIECFFHQI